MYIFHFIVKFVQNADFLVKSREAIALHILKLTLMDEMVFQKAYKIN